MEIKSKLPPERLRSLAGMLAWRFLLMLLFLGLLLFLPAGTFGYWQGWLYIALLALPMLFAARYFWKKDPAFLERRMLSREKERGLWALQLFSTLVFFSWYIVSGLDRRFGWSQVPSWLVAASALMMLSGYMLVFAVFRQNSYASRVVQVSAGQELITSGLYAKVRHPMYGGVLLMYVFTPLVLGSYWAMVSTIFFPFILVFRIRGEERLLRKELPGYEEYCAKTRYRLFPGIW